MLRKWEVWCIKRLFSCEDNEPNGFYTGLRLLTKTWEFDFDQFFIHESNTVFVGKDLWLMACKKVCSSKKEDGSVGST